MCSLFSQAYIHSSNPEYTVRSIATGLPACVFPLLSIEPGLNMRMTDVPFSYVVTNYER